MPCLRANEAHRAPERRDEERLERSAREHGDDGVAAAHRVIRAEDDRKTARRDLNGAGDERQRRRVRGARVQVERRAFEPHSSAIARGREAKARIEEPIHRAKGVALGS